MADYLAFNAVIEVPAGSRNKYEFDHSSGRIWLDRKLFTATRYPADYGFIPETLSEDGDPLDVLVLLDEPAFPGCWIECRPVGVMWMADEHGRDAKILALPTWDSRTDVQSIEHVQPRLLNEIQHFFAVYKGLEPGKDTSVESWEGRVAAVEEIERSRRRWREAHGV